MTVKDLEICDSIQCPISWHHSILKREESAVSGKHTWDRLRSTGTPPTDNDRRRERRDSHNCARWSHLKFSTPFGKSNTIRYYMLIAFKLTSRTKETLWTDKSHRWMRRCWSTGASSANEPGKTGRSSAIKCARTVAVSSSGAGYTLWFVRNTSLIVECPRGTRLWLRSTGTEISRRAGIVQVREPEVYIIWKVLGEQVFLWSRWLGSHCAIVPTITGTRRTH